MHLNKHISRSLQLQKYLSYEAHFFSKHWKFIVDCKNAKKMSQKICGFSDSLIYVGNAKFSLLIREYSSLGVKVLSSSPKISDPIENNLFELNLVQKDEKVG